MDDRRFDEKEVGEILMAAAEMQVGLASSAEGMTLGELQTVAQEIGIRPENIVQAAQELGSPLKSQARNSSDSVLLERVVEGELSDEAWDEYVTALRRFTGRPGRVASNGQSREWVCQSDRGSTLLSATSRRGRTRVRLLGDSSGAAVVTGALTFMVLLMTIPITIGTTTQLSMSPYLIAALTLTIAGLGMLLARTIIRAQRKAFAQRMDGLLVELVGIGETRSGLEQPVLSTLEDTESFSQDLA